MLQKTAQAEVERCSTPLMATMIGLPCPSSSLPHSGTPQILQGAKTKGRRGWKVSVLSWFCSSFQRSGGLYRRMFLNDGYVAVASDFPASLERCLRLSSVASGDLWVTAEELVASCVWCPGKAAALNASTPPQMKVDNTIHDLGHA